MKLKCPACGALASLEVFLAHEGAREALLLALKFPAPLGRLLVSYLALFRPESRDLSFDRVATLLAELLPLIEAGQFERNKRTWPAPQEYWRAGLEAVLEKRDRLDLPLKTHGYLLEIIAGMSNRAEATAERKAEETRRFRPKDERPAAAIARERGEIPQGFRDVVAKVTGRGKATPASAGTEEQRRDQMLKDLAAAQGSSTEE